MWNWTLLDLLEGCVGVSKEVHLQDPLNCKYLHEWHSFVFQRAKLLIYRTWFLVGLVSPPKKKKHFKGLADLDLFCRSVSCLSEEFPSTQGFPLTSRWI